MKRLTLVRHAHAVREEGDDFSRPLTKAGQTEVVVLAHALSRAKLLPDLLVSSSAQRARQTAEILEHELALPHSALQLEQSLYLAKPGDILELVRRASSSVGHQMIVGHNPGLSDLVMLLAPRAGISELQTAAACTMEFSVDAWSSIDYRKALRPRLEPCDASPGVWP